YGDAVTRGESGYAKFIRTGSRGGALKRDTRQDLYLTFHYGIKRGVYLFLLVALSSFDPIKFLAWSPQIFMVTIGWWFGPFWLNPTIDKKVDPKLHRKQLRENFIWDPLWAMGYALVEAAFWLLAWLPVLSFIGLVGGIGASFFIAITPWFFAL